MRNPLAVSRRTQLRAAIVLLAIAASAIGIVNQYAYDDVYIVKLDTIVHTLHHWWRLFHLSYWPVSWGGDGYRPLTMLAFSTEWIVGHGNAMIFHAVNIVVYAADSLLVFELATLLLPMWAAWLAGAIFAVNPVHVEAVANIVGQAEVVAALFMLVALVLYLRARRTEPDGMVSVRTGAAIACCYALACLTKEHGVVLPALFVAAEWSLIDRPASWRERATRLRPFYLVLGGIALVYLAIHWVVLSANGIGGFQPFEAFRALQLTTSERILTMFGVVPEWLRLFYWPVRLSSEYAPPDIQLAQGLGLWQLPGFLLLVSIIALGFALRRKRPVTAFGIAWVCISLLPSSNFIVPAGIVLAERTLFLPSVGAMLVAADVAWWAAPYLRARGYHRVCTAVLGVLIVAAAVRSEFRTTVWQSDGTLFRQAVVDAPLDYRAHYMLGAWDFDQKRKSEGEREYWRAIQLFPFDPFVAYNMATQYRLNGMCRAALPLYKWAYASPSQFGVGKGEYAWCLLNQGQYHEAREWAFAAMRHGEGPLKALRYLVTAADSALAAGGERTGSVAVSADSSGKVPKTVQKAASRATGSHVQ